MDLTTPTVYTEAIKAQDFAFAANEPQYESWTPGKLRHLLAALTTTPAPVILVTNRKTSATVVGVELVGLVRTETPEPRLAYRWLGTDGETYRGEIPLDRLGPITPMPATTVVNARLKAGAVEAYREEVAFAIEVAKTVHGAPEGRRHGRWVGEPMAEGVYVGYSPDTSHPDRFEDWGTPWQGRVVDGKVIASRSF